MQIDQITDNDLNGFKAYLAEDDTLYFPEPETFATEKQALAFCFGIGYGINERASIERYPLRSCEPADVPFIELIELRYGRICRIFAADLWCSQWYCQ